MGKPVETKYATIDRDELKRLQKDAERYRFLMRHAEEIYYLDPRGYPGYNLPVGDKEKCDAAIDAAMGDEHV